MLFYDSRRARYASTDVELKREVPRRSYGSGRRRASRPTADLKPAQLIIASREENRIIMDAGIARTVLDSEEPAEQAVA